MIRRNAASFSASRSSTCSFWSAEKPWPMRGSALVVDEGRGRQFGQETERVRINQGRILCRRNRRIIRIKLRHGDGISLLPDRIEDGVAVRSKQA